MHLLGAGGGVVEQELEIGMTAVRKRRRRSSTSRSRTRTTRLDRRLLLVMSVVLAAYVGLGLFRTERQMASYDGVKLGASHNAIRYLKGPPKAADAANQQWVYEEGGTINRINFVGDNVSSSSCELAAKNLIACPAVFGVGAGATISELLYRLGPPDRSRIDPDGNAMFYDGLGYVFLLREETITKITHVPQGSPGGYVRDTLWQFIP